MSVYADNAHNRRIGRAGQPRGTHIVHNDGSETRGGQRVYAESRAGLGQPVGTHNVIVHNNAPGTATHSPRVYVDNAENRRIGRAGQPVGTHIVHNNSTVREYVDNAENRRAGQPVGTHVLHRSQGQEERQAPLVTTPYRVASLQLSTISSPTQNDRVQTSGQVSVSESHCITRAEQAMRTHVHNNAYGTETSGNQSQDRVSRPTPTAVVPVTVSTRTSPSRSSTSTLSATQSQSRSTAINYAENRHLGSVWQPVLHNDSRSAPSQSADVSSPSDRSTVATTVNTRSVVAGIESVDEPDTTSEDVIYIEVS